MTYLREHTKVPVPKIFHWASESDLENEIGVSYILMEMLGGKPLEWHATNLEQKEKIMQQLVEIFLEIEKHPFGSMGSLLAADSSARLEIRGVAQPETYRMEACGPLGPFPRYATGLMSMIERHLQLISNGEICASNSVNVYLSHRLRLDVAKYMRNDGSCEEKFFIKHPDDKGDHILVNTSYDIVGLIDWEWTRTASKEEAFSSPCMMWPVAEFYKGSNDLSEDELRLAKILQDKGRQDLSDCVLQGRRLQRVLFALGTESSNLDHQTFLNLFQGLQTALGLEAVPWTQWRAQALVSWQDDSLLQALIQLEN